ncbi:MarR family winged helix-turn-helix transcriptional regulator [Maridesulfovibrio sp.]|uniref:MarR family winged helix-turn-helix transcriptional regulator n=1 Tax=Maridesulfovibrio sp. TaxID=2795000 RepID=UPI003BAD5C5C
MKHRSFGTPTETMELSTLLQYASRLMGRMHHCHHHMHQGQHAQGKVISILLEHGPMSQSQLLEILDIRSSSLSELISKLERNGLISRERNEADRRSFIVSATKEAEEVFSNQGNAERESIEQLFPSLENKEKEELRRLLLKIVDSLKDQPEPKRGRGRCHHDHGLKKGKRDMNGRRGHRRK